MSTIAAVERVPIALRIPRTALREIDRQALAHKLTRTEYIIGASTGTLPHTTAEAIHRIEALETAVERLQTLAYGE